MHANRTDGRVSFRFRLKNVGELLRRVFPFLIRPGARSTFTTNHDQVVDTRCLRYYECESIRRPLPFRFYHQRGRFVKRDGTPVELRLDAYVIRWPRVSDGEKKHYAQREQWYVQNTPVRYNTSVTHLGRVDARAVDESEMKL